MGVTNNRNAHTLSTSGSSHTNTNSSSSSSTAAAAAAAHRAQLHLRHVSPVHARKGCTKASPLAPQQKSIYVKAFLVWSVCTLGGWLSIDTEYLPLWSHLVGFGFFLTITTRKTRWLGALVIAALVFSSLMYQLLPQNWVTTLTNSVGYGGIALALMLAFLCRRAANHSSIPSFDIDYSQLQLPEDLLQILSTISGHPAVAAATAHAAQAAAAITKSADEVIGSFDSSSAATTANTTDPITAINTNDVTSSSSSSSSNHMSDDIKKGASPYSNSAKAKHMNEETSPFLGDEYHARLVEYPASRSDLCALICQMHRMQHHQMMMARNAAAEQQQQITQLSAQLDLEVERRLRAESALARATTIAAAAAAGNASSTSSTSAASNSTTVSSSSHSSTSSAASSTVAVISCECGRRYDRDGNKLRRKDRNSTTSTQLAVDPTLATSTHWEKERSSLTQQLQVAVASKQESDAQVQDLQSQVNRLKSSLHTATSGATLANNLNASPPPAATTVATSSSSSSSSGSDDSSTSSAHNNGSRSVRDWNQLRASLQRAESTIESYDTQLNELRRSATRRHAMAKAASARMALRMEALTIENTNLRKQMAALNTSSGRQSGGTSNNSGSSSSRSSKSRVHRASVSESTPLNIPSVPSSLSSSTASLDASLSTPAAAASNSGSSASSSSIDDSIESSGADSPLSSSSPSTCPPSPSSSSSLHSAITSSPLPSLVGSSGSSMSAQRSLLHLSPPLIIDDNLVMASTTTSLMTTTPVFGDDDEYVTVSVDDEANLPTSHASSSSAEIDNGAGMQLLCQQLVRFLDDPHEPNTSHTDIA